MEKLVTVEQLVIVVIWEQLVVMERLVIVVIVETVSNCGNCRTVCNCGNWGNG